MPGAVVSSFYINSVGRNKVYAYTLPMIVEILILMMIFLFGHHYDKTIIKQEFFAGSLLFAMGMQNAMVSMVSGSVVRTTHLTGIFTDLGIDISILIHTAKQSREEVGKRIFLRLMIILFFLGGGVAGALLYHKIQYTAFIIPSAILVITIFYDYFRVYWSRLWLHWRSENRR